MQWGRYAAPLLPTETPHFLIAMDDHSPTHLRWLATTVLGLGLLLSAPAQAALHVQATRVIYDGSAASASLALSNKGTLPYMAQAWLDRGDASSMPANLPITITPPLMRLAAGEEAVLRVIHSGTGLPADRESLFWINVQEIPPRTQDSNVLQVAIRTRVKLFYRPKGLRTTLDANIRSLRWQLRNDTLVVSNPGPLHITFVHVQGQASAGPRKRIDLDMIAPGQSFALPLSQLGHPPGDTLRFAYINDHGGVTEVDEAAIER